SAELIAFDRVALRCEWVPRVEHSVSHKLKQIAVKLVRAGFRYQAHGTRRLHAALSGGGSGLYFELLQGIRKRQGHVPIVEWIVVIGPVQGVVQSRVKSTCDGNIALAERIAAAGAVDNRCGRGPAG